MKIFYQGIKGSYSSATIIKYFPYSEAISCESFLEVFQKWIYPN